MVAGAFLLPSSVTYTCPVSYHSPMNTGNSLTLSTFLESAPLLEPRSVTLELKNPASGHSSEVAMPAVYLYCPGEPCRGLRFYDYRGHSVSLPSQGKYREFFLAYVCRNCEGSLKTYAVRVIRTELNDEVQTLVKIGEMPRFGEPRPNIVTDVLDDEIKFFEYGYRAETDGLGIGAFAYYRRFVESHKDTIIAEIRKVAVSQSLSPSIVEALDRGATKGEFKSAVEEIKEAIPDALRINGTNPLTLLHNALSGGLDNDDDVECLEIAQDIRTVLTALAGRTSELLKSESAVKEAVTRLNQRNARQKPGP